jgi:polar amino acid transport system substrate-binding protein
MQMLGTLLFIAACSESGPGETQQVTQPQSAAPPEQPSCELVMGWDPWEPYQYEIAGGQVFGLDVDLLTAVVRNADCEITFRRGTWRELLHKLKAGEIDLLGGATRTADREQFAYFTVPYRAEQFSIFIAANRISELGVKPFEQLLSDGLRFGVIEDYLYGEPVSSSQDDPQFQDRFVYSSMAEINISRLLHGEVDGIIEDKFVGASIIRHKNLGSDIVRHPIRLSSNPVSIMVSRASVDDALFSKINASVGELQSNGAIDKVQAQYLNP